mmetsp:Transcript_110948/g.313883  ORF Transcript_110948/g.313883 Transcript_110948/m.313883 type:complete len:213 (-) Transcript_110948:499-1137(-)
MGIVASAVSWLGSCRSVQSIRARLRCKRCGGWVLQQELQQPEQQFRGGAKARMCIAPLYTLDLCLRHLPEIQKSSPHQLWGPQATPTAAFAAALAKAAAVAAAAPPVITLSLAAVVAAGGFAAAPTEHATTVHHSAAAAAAAAAAVAATAQAASPVYPAVATFATAGAVLLKAPATALRGTEAGLKYRLALPGVLPAEHVVVAGSLWRHHGN